MTDSAVSNKVTGNSPAEAAPQPPVLAGPTFSKLQAALVVTMPTTDTNGEPLGANLNNIKVFYGPAGSDLSAVAPLEFPGDFPPGSQQTVTVTVPVWNTAFDFEAEVSS